MDAGIIHYLLGQMREGLVPGAAAAPVTVRATARRSEDLEELDPVLEANHKRVKEQLRQRALHKLRKQCGLEDVDLSGMIAMWESCGSAASWHAHSG